MINDNRFFEELGNLFYAIAAADKKIISEERQRINDVILFGWLHSNVSTDLFGTSSVYRIQFEFDRMEEKKSKPADAWRSFSSWFRKHKKEIDTDTCVKVYNSASHIADCHNDTEKEKKYLSRLKKLMGV